MERKITDTIYYAGVKDTTLDLFEGQIGRASCRERVLVPV